MDTTTPNEAITETNASHVGWIPCLSGRLDFAATQVRLSGYSQHWGKVNKRYKNTHINYAKEGENDCHVRRLFVSSRVDWKDLPSPRTGAYQVVMTGDCNYSADITKRTLSGQILIFPTALKKTSFDQAITRFRSLVKKHKVLRLKPLMWLYKKLTFVRLSQNLIDNRSVYDTLMGSILSFDNTSLDIRGTLVEQQERYNKEFENFKSIQETLTPEACQFVLGVDYRIENDGIIFLKFNALNRNPKSTLSDKDQYYVIRQAYYYIKYTLHLHKHHLNDADSLTKPVPNNEDAWLQLLDQHKRNLMLIKRKIVGIKPHTPLATNPLGMIAYCKTLLLILKKRKPDKESTFKIEEDSFNNLELSFESRDKQMALQLSAHNFLLSIRSFWSSTALFILSIITFAIYQLYDIKTNEPLTMTLTELITIYGYAAAVIFTIIQMLRIKRLFAKIGSLATWLIKSNWVSYLFPWLATVGLVYFLTYKIF